MKTLHSYNLNFNEIRNIIDQTGFSFMDNINIENYTGICSKYHLIDSNGYKYYCRLQHIINGHPPHIVSSNNPYSVENIHLWIKQHNKPFILLSTNFNDSHTYLEFECQNCHSYFQRTWNNIYNGNGCRKCRYEKQKELQIRPRNKERLMLSDYPNICADWSQDNQYSFERYSARSGYKVKWKCSQCQYEWGNNYKSPSKR